MILVLCGCASGKEENSSTPARGTDNTVIDASGVELYIPETGDTSIASVYAVAVPFFVALELSDRVIAVNYKSQFWADSVEGLAKAGTVGRGIVDLELLAEYAPDVLVHRSNDWRTIEAVSELGIPVMSIRAENFDEIIGTLDLMGRYFYAETRAEEVKGWMNGKFDKIGKIVQDIPADKRFTAIVMGGELGIVAGGDMLQSWMLEQAGAVSPARDITESGSLDASIPTAWSNIGAEKIFEMNPDVIFCTSSTVLDYSVEEILQSPAWSEVEAVKTGRVALIPAKWDSWDLPGINCALGTMWMLNRMYPECFSREELEEEIDDYYTFMFGRTFDSEYLGYELNVSPQTEDTGSGPGAVRIDGVEIPEFSFKVKDTTITDKDMAAYPVYSVETTSTNTYGTTTTRVYVGYAISDVLKAAGATEAFSTLVTLADDGYKVSVSKDVALEPTTLAAITEDGKFFKKGLWFAPCVSDVSPDYLRDLALIAFEN